MTTIKINTEFIKLNQFLKWANVAESGAAANHMIIDGLIKVNGEVEQRRGRKLYPGDTVEVQDIGSFLVK